MCISLLFLIIDKYSVGKQREKIRKFNNFVLFLSNTECDDAKREKMKDAKLTTE